MKRKAKIIFITGTDTGAGKTVMTAMLLHYLRKQGCHALAMKPFCSGSTSDVDILEALQEGELTSQEINPYYFTDPVAPIASKSCKRRISLSGVVRKIEAIAERCEVLLVEGCGGLKVPISANFLLIDVISKLKCPVILVGQNKLGILNHVLLSEEALHTRGLNQLIIALMEQEKPDLSASNNAQILKKRTQLGSVFSISFLGRKLHEIGELKKSVEKIKTIVAHARRCTYLPPLVRKTGRNGNKKIRLTVEKKSIS